jgi:hypothetical protein
MIRSAVPLSRNGSRRQLGPKKVTDRSAECHLYSAGTAATDESGFEAGVFGHAKANWQFKTADARVKLKRLYPQFE